jgi:peptide/nickel transport system substrate-binding protein
MRPLISRILVVPSAVIMLFSAARSAPAAPEGTMTWGVHITLASRWLDPAETEGIITPFMVLYALHDALVKPMPGNINTPSLAESWTQSKDGLTYEFVLRKGVKFHNGEPVTAADVKFSFERYRGAGAKLLKERVREVQIVDAGRVRFLLKEPWPDFMTFYGTSATGAGWVVPKAYVEKVGEDGFKRAPIGAGPYKFVSFDPGVELVMEAYEGYWRKVPNLKRLVYRSMPEETTRAAALKKGEVDIAYLLSGPVAEDIRRTPGLKLVAPREPQGSFWLDLPDQWDPKSPWHDRRVRQAASHAIDRQALNEAETLGFSKPTGSLIPRALQFSRFFEPDPFDPARAKRLLAEAGYPNGFDAGELYPWPPQLLDGRGAGPVSWGRGHPDEDPDHGARGHDHGVAGAQAEERDRRHHRGGRQRRHATRRVHQQERHLYLRCHARRGGSLPAPGPRDGRQEARSADPPDPADSP